MTPVIAARPTTAPATSALEGPMLPRFQPLWAEAEIEKTASKRMTAMILKDVIMDFLLSVYFRPLSSIVTNLRIPGLTDNRSPGHSLAAAYIAKYRRRITLGAFLKQGDTQEKVGGRRLRVKYRNQNAPAQAHCLPRRAKDDCAVCDVRRFA